MNALKNYNCEYISFCKKFDYIEIALANEKF
jgi:hypothetical protein